MQTRRPTTRAIIQEACKLYGVSVEDLTKRCRKMKMVRMRQPIHYLCWLEQTDTLEEIAVSTGLLRHATVLNSIGVIEGEYGMYDDVKEKVDGIREAMIESGYTMKPILSVKYHKREADPFDTDNAWCFNKIIPVRVIDKQTGVHYEVRTIAQASYLTGVYRRKISQECKGQRGATGRYKFQYYEQP